MLVLVAIVLRADSISRVEEKSVNERGEATTRDIVFDAATKAEKDEWLAAIESVLAALAAKKREVQTGGLVC